LDKWRYLPADGKTWGVPRGVRRCYPLLRRDSVYMAEKQPHLESEGDVLAIIYLFIVFVKV